MFAWIKEAWKYVKSILGLSINIKRLSNQITNLREQLRSPEIYRQEIDYLRDHFHLLQEAIETRARKAIEVNDLETKKKLDEAKERLEEKDKELNRIWELAKQSTDSLKKAVKALELERKKNEQLGVQMPFPFGDSSPPYTSPLAAIIAANRRRRLLDKE